MDKVGMIALVSSVGLAGVLGTSVFAYQWWQARKSLNGQKSGGASDSVPMVNETYRKLGEVLYRGFRKDLPSALSTVEDRLFRMRSGLDIISGLYEKSVEFPCISKGWSDDLAKIKEVEELLRAEGAVFKSCSREEIEQLLTKAKGSNEESIKGFRIGEYRKHIFSKNPDDGGYCTIVWAERRMAEENQDLLFTGDVSKDEVSEKIMNAKKEIAGRKVRIGNYAAIFNDLEGITESGYIDVAKDIHDESADVFFEMLGKTFVQIFDEPEVSQMFEAEGLGKYIRMVKADGDKAPNEHRENVKDLEWIRDTLYKLRGEKE